MKILVMENDKKQQKELIDLLESQELETVTAKQQSEVLTHLNSGEGSAEIILAEFDMPSFDGFDLINSILAADLSTFPYIIFLINEEAYQRAVDSLGPIPGDFLVRPYSPNELKARLAMAERALALQNRLGAGVVPPSETLALYDQLTGVMNRQAVYERSLAEHNRGLREKTGFSIAMIEVYNLEEIFEKHGEQVKNQALRFVARATRANVRIYDLVGRWIGSKFFVMLPGASVESARGVIDRISKSVTTIRIRVPDGGQLELDVRVGYTTTSGENVPPLYELIEQANDALKSLEKEDAENIRLFHDL